MPPGEVGRTSASDLIEPAILCGIPGLTGKRTAPGKYESAF